MKAYFEILRKDEVRFRPGQNTMPWHDQPEGTAADKAAVEYAQTVRTKKLLKQLRPEDF